MKRLVTFAVVIVAAVLFVACSSPLKDETSRKNGLNCAFRSEVQITIDKLNADGTLTRYGDGAWEVEFSSPNTLSGVNLKFTEGSVAASYKGLNFSVPQSAIPVKAMMLCLMEAVDTNARLEELKGSENGNMLEITGTIDGGEYILSVDKNGTLSSFEMKNNKLRMIFLDVQEISPVQQETSGSETDMSAAAEETTTVAEEQTSEAA